MALHVLFSFLLFCSSWWGICWQQMDLAWSVKIACKDALIFFGRCLGNRYFFVRTFVMVIIPSVTPPPRKPCSYWWKIMKGSGSNLGRGYPLQALSVSIALHARFCTSKVNHSPAKRMIGEAAWLVKLCGEEVCSSHLNVSAPWGLCG